MFVFLLRLGRQLACGAHQDSDRVSGVIDLRDTTDFKMNLIMKDFEPHILAHHSGHVHLELGATAHSGSSIRRLTSASWHFSLRQPCLPTSVPPVFDFIFSRRGCGALAFVARGATPESFAAGGAHAPLCLLNFLGSSRTLGVVSRSA